MIEVAAMIFITICFKTHKYIDRAKPQFHLEIHIKYNDFL